MDADAARSPVWIDTFMKRFHSHEYYVHKHLPPPPPVASPVPSYSGRDTPPRAVSPRPADWWTSYDLPVATAIVPALRPSTIQGMSPRALIKQPLSATTSSPRASTASSTSRRETVSSSERAAQQVSPAQQVVYFAQASVPRLLQRV